MSQEATAFYLHEDDWGMAELLPSENLAFLHEEHKRLDAFSAVHFDGIAWTVIRMLHTSIRLVTGEGLGASSEARSERWSRLAFANAHGMTSML